MSHHYSGPEARVPARDARLDFTDLYAFPKPGDPSKSILIMDVHPSVGQVPPGPTTAEPFAPEALYEIMVDTNGDRVADIAYQMRFASSKGGALTATVRCAEGADAAKRGERGKVIVEGVAVSMGREANVKEAGEYRFFAGWRSDPFFFDVVGAVSGFKFTGTDFFVDKDICSMVLEVPNTALGRKEVALWARTVVQVDGRWVQADRGARPSQTPFLSGDANEAYREAEPAGDARFIEVFAHALEHMGGFSPEEAKGVAATLLPDVLRYDPTRAASFPENGRALRDDVADFFLALSSNGKVKGDGVGPHDDLLTEFPYLGPPHDGSR